MQYCGISSSLLAVLKTMFSFIQFKQSVAIGSHCLLKRNLCFTSLHQKPTDTTRVANEAFHEYRISCELRLTKIPSIFILLLFRLYVTCENYTYDLGLPYFTIVIELSCDSKLIL